MNMVNRLHLLLLLGISSIAFGQNATIAIENAHVLGDRFSWEIHLTPTDDWSSTGNSGLGDCSWYFTFNSDVLTNPTIVYEGSAVDSLENYVNTIGITGTGDAARIYIDTDFTLNLSEGMFGVQLEQGTNYHLYTVQMAITDAEQLSGLTWDQINTGVFTAFDAQIIESYSGNGNISLQDVTPPTVQQVTAVSQDGGYREGETIEIAVQFTEPVTVTGIPTLELETGTIDHNASYVTGSGSYLLHFFYIIQPGDNNTDLDYTSTDAFGLNTGSIQDGAGNDANIVLAEPGAEYSLSWNSQLIIDTETPSMVSGTANDINTYVDLTFSEGVYSTQDDGGGLDADDLILAFAQNNGHATEVNLVSVSSVSGGALSGGEDIVRLWITVTGLPNGDETVSISPTDGNSIYDLTGNPMSVSASVTINLTTQFIPPVIVVSPDSLNYLENSGFTVVDSTITVEDENNTHLDSAWVMFTVGYDSTEDTLICSGTDNIIADYDVESGMLTLTGHAPVEDYQTALRSILYKNNSDNPLLNLRTVQFIVNDGGGNSDAVSRSIVVIPVNDTPMLTFADTTINYIENADPIFIVTDLNISDLDDVNLDTAWVGITSGYISNEDTLTIESLGNAQVSFDDSTGLMTVTGILTLAEYEEILSSTKYQNSSENPVTETRTIEFAVNDGDDSSVGVVRQITITPVNDAPVLSVIGIQITNEDTAKVISLFATDVENDNLFYSVSCEESNVFLTLENTSLTIETAPNWNGTAYITVTVTDNGEGNLIDSETFELIINPVNDLPNALATTGNGPVGGTITIPMEATDIDNADPSEFTFIVVTPPTHISGEVSIGDVSYAFGTFTATATYQHDGMGSFTDTLTYKANDGEDDSDIATAIRSVNPADYEYSSTMTALLQMDYEPLGDGNMIAAFSNDECVGIAEPTYELGQWLYFLTFYSNSPGDTVEFYAWRSENDLVYPLEESIVFQPSINYGTPLDPYLLNIVLDYDYPPVVADIPDQIIEVYTDFNTFDLDDYVTSLDGDSISWSTSGETNLDISIDDNNVVMAIPTNPEWIGSELITFIATDQTDSAFFAGDNVLFTVLPVDHLPILSGVSGQEVGYYQPFVSFYLNDYITETDGDSVVLSYIVEAPVEPDARPGWSVTPTDFIMSMTVTAQVQSQGNIMDGSGHTLAAFSGEECRGTAVPTYFSGTWIYFMSVYANSAGEEITFRFYDEHNQQDLPIREALEFSSGASFGSPQSPYELNAGHFLLDIDENSLVTVEKVEELWAGSETINFIVTDVGTLHDYSDTSSAVFTVFQDYAPVVSGIEDQTVEQSVDFATFDLDDYLTELDGHVVAWSISGETNLDVTIDADNVATVTPLNPDWTGSEDITFTVTDQTASGFYTSDVATFTILPYDNPPVLSGVPDQSVGYYQPFESFYLDDYLTELDNDSLMWNYIIEHPIETDPIPSWTVNPSDYTMAMIVTASVQSQGQPAQGSTHILAAFSGEECRGTATAIDFVGTWIYNLTVFSDSAGEVISFRFYDDEYEQNIPAMGMVDFASGESIGTPQSPHELNAGHFLVDIDEYSHVNIEQVEALWAGSETISFIVQDQGSLHEYSDTTSAVYTVYQDYAPVVDGIPDQTIEQTTDFTLFDLDDYLTELDGHEVAWTVTGNVNLDVFIDGSNVVAVSPFNNNWTGTEEITFIVTDQTTSGFYTSDDVQFTILPYDNPPSVSDFPDQVITLGEVFQPITLADNLEELDGDSIAWRFDFVPPEEADPSPDWSVNLYDYELSMTATVMVISRDKLVTGENHILGAFYQNECRGAAVPYYAETLDRWLYFLTIYSNNNDEEITFRFYDGEFGSNFPVLESVNFMSNTSNGDPANPLLLQAGDFIIDFSSQIYGYIQQVEQGLTGSSDILITVQDVGSIHEYADTARVSITVNNDWPVIEEIVDIVFNEDEITTYDLNEYISDYGTPDWGMTWSTSGNEHVFIEFANGVATITSEENWNGMEIVGLTSTDDDETNPLSTTTPVTIIVAPVNDAPIANGGDDQSHTVVHDQNPLTNSVAISLNGIGTDIDGDDLEFSWILEDDTLSTSSEYTTELIAGNYTFFLTVSDGELTALDSVNITINPEENTTPTANVLTETMDEDTELSIILTADDIDGDDLMFTLLDSTETGIITGDIPRLSYTPYENVNGQDNFKFSVTDGYGASDTAEVTITISPVNDIPVFAYLPNQSLADIGDTLIFNVSATDIDGDEFIMSIESDSVLSGAIFTDNNDGSGTFNWTPVPADTGNYPVTFLANDGMITGEMDIIISIGDMNRPPELATIGSKEVAETDTLIIDISAYDSDGDSLYFQVDSLPEGSVFADNQDSTATFTWIPDYDDAGEYEVTVTVSDMFNLSDAETFTIIVHDVNRPPVADAAEITTDEDTAIELILSGTDLDGDSLSYAVMTQPLFGVYADGVYSPNTNLNGVDSLMFRVSDGELADTATVRINITPVNDAPIVNAGEDQEVTIVHDGDPLTDTTLVTLNGNGSDIDGDSLGYSWMLDGIVESEEMVFAIDLTSGEYTFILTVDDGELSTTDSVGVIVNPEPNTLPQAYTQGVTTLEDTEIPIILNGSDTNGDSLNFAIVSEPTNGSLTTDLPGLTYSPNLNIFGTDTFTFHISDGYGFSDTANIIITIEAVNDSPVADDQEVITDEDMPITFTVSVLDVDFDSLAFVVLDSTVNGTISGILPELTYTPTTNYIGTDSLLFTVSDGSLSDTAQVNIVVQQINDPPIIVSIDTQTIDEDSSLEVILSAADVDGDNLIYTVSSADTNVTANITNDTLLTLIPTENWNGTADITVTVTDDGTGTLSDSTTFTLAVTPINDAPVADALSDTTNEDTPITFELTGSDVDEDSLTFTVIDSTTHGTMTGILPILMYTPELNYSGSDTLSFSVNDGNLMDTAMVYITVESINDAPIADEQFITTDEDVPVEIILTGMDVEDSILTFTVIDEPSHGIYSDNVYFPDENYYGADSLTFHVSDGELSDTATIFLSINAINDAPIITASLEDVTIDEDDFGAVIIPRLEDYFNDIDVGDFLVFTSNALNDGLDSVTVGSINLNSLAFASNYNGKSVYTIKRSIIKTTKQKITKIPKQKKCEKGETINTSLVTSFQLNSSFNKIGSRADSTALVVYPTENFVGDIDIEVLATDTFDEFVSDTLTLTIENINDAPVAVAVDDQIVIGGMEVTLDGGGSFDIEESELTYNWLAEGDVALTVNGAIATFTAPDENAEILFTLTVNDGELDSEPDSTLVTINMSAVLDTLPDFAEDPPKAGDSIEITYSFPEFFEVYTAALYYAAGGSPFEGMPMESVGSGLNRTSGILFSAVIPGDVNTYNGTAYYIEAVDINSNTLTTETVSIPVQIPADSVTSLSKESYYPEGIQKKVWRMVSVPSDLDDDAVDAMYNAVLGSSGEYDWRLYEWNGTEWTESSQFTQGEGYWFNQWVDDTVSFDLGSGLTSDLTGTDINLLPGWNLISSPYLFPVRVYIDSSIFTGLYEYGYYEGEGWNPELTNELKPWGGYAVFNRSEENQIFTIDPLNQPDILLAKLVDDSEGWNLSLNLTCDGYSDLGTTIGRHSKANKDCDAFDRPKPVSPGDYISLRVRQPEWIKGLRSLYSDIRSTEEINGSWDLELKTKGNHGKLTVNTELTGQFPPEYDIIIIDCINGQIVDLNQNASFTIERYSEDYPRKYTVIAGETNYVKSKIEEIQSLIPKEFTLSQNYPNPFNPTTTIEYSVAKPGNVHIIIYDMLGREVKTLVNTFHDVGYKQVQWNGTNSQGVSVATGMYLCRLNAPGISIIRKMVLLK